MKFHHIGCLVEDINTAIKFYNTCGFTQHLQIIDDSLRGIKIAFITANDTCIELIQSIQQDSAVSGMVKKRNFGLYHQCFETKNIDDKIQELEQQKFIIVQAPQKAVAFNNRRVGFLFHRNIGLIEVLESEDVDFENSGR